MSTRSILALVLLLLAPAAGAQTGRAPDLKAQIAALSSLDYATRMNAARQIRRVAAGEAVPALTEAAKSHPDEYVRFRALVLLTAFNDRSTPAVMRDLLRYRNDRVREVAYKWFEDHPDRDITPLLLGALQTEQAEFVRPALVGALAALGMDPQVQRALVAEAPRGLDIFRAAVVDALGRHRATYAVDALIGMVKIDGPLRDDVMLALGRIGDARAAAALREAVTEAGELGFGPRAAQCLLAKDCDATITWLAATATTLRAQATVVAAVAALRDIGASGRAEVIDPLLDITAKAETLRDQTSVALATIAVRHPELTIDWLDRAPAERRAAAVALLKDGFDALEEEYGKEQFFAATRASYWKVPEGAPTRSVMAAVIEKLEF